MRKLASIQKILQLKEIPNADNILCAEILGWQTVVSKKDNFQIGQLCVFIEVDSICPATEIFEFLKERKYRIRTIRLKKQVSQGLVLPLSVLPKKNWNEGDDVTEILGIRKYDPEGEKEQKLLDEKLSRSNNRIDKFFKKYSWYRNLVRMMIGKKEKGWPKFIKKTDEDRIQLFPHICETEKDTIFSVTEKLDGQSGTYFLVKNKNRILFGPKYIFGVCSRNLYLKKEDNSSYWIIARQYKIKEVLEKIIDGCNFVVLQGEILGEGIQGNKYGIAGKDFYAFNLIYPTKQLDSYEAKSILQCHGIKFVPILDLTFKLKSSVHEMVEYAKGKSAIIYGLREGVIIRNYEKGISFKVINPEFLLKFEE